jgi:hypothetical protein
MNPWTKVIFVVFAATVAFSIRRLLQGVLEVSLIEGIAFWLFFAISYPFLSAWSKYSGKPITIWWNGFLIYLYGLTLATGLLIILAKVIL